MVRQRVLILGAGPTGLGAAWQLARRSIAEVIVVEQRGEVGGNAGSFNLDSIPVDYGSHRLHPACEPHILRDIQTLLGPDLLKRPRHGRIRLRGRWIHFPLQPIDLMMHLPWSFRLGVARDALAKVIPRRFEDSEPTFASVLQQGLGQTICRDFYFPYAQKIWGLPPEHLSPIQAERRVSASSLTKMMCKVIGLKTGSSTNARHFFYPRRGYGQISRAIADAAQHAGAQIRLFTTVQTIRTNNSHQVEINSNGETTTIEADHIWSTIPLAVLARLVDPPPPPEVLGASRHIESRAMLLVYLVLAEEQFTPYDAHYFPGSDVRLTRLSEPKNYSAQTDVSDRTVLCAEIPCSIHDSLWNASDQELVELVRNNLSRCDLPIQSSIAHATTKRLSHAYPIYHRGYEDNFRILDKWAMGLDRVLTFGRQGLFAHDNTHHALAMAYAAVDCLSDFGEVDKSRWQEYRTEFLKHVVED